jgi:hypothetical protein
VRGGAIPLLAWGTVLLVLLIGNWVWTGDSVQVGLFAMATGLIYASAALLVGWNRQALRRGPPPETLEPEAVPQSSLAAALVGLGIACTGFGVVWAGFLIYFGLGVVVLSFGRLLLELRAERSELETIRESQQ